MILSKLFGTKSEREIKKLSSEVDKINHSYKLFLEKSDEDLINRTKELRDFVISTRDEKINSVKDITDKKIRDEKILKAEQGALDLIMTEAFAIVKVICERMCGESWSVSGQKVTWNMIPYDVQILGAIILHKGKVAEMKTGEGKTLVATMPIYLNALTGRGVHVITVNDYLAQRDAEWMGEVYKRLGLTVGYILKLNG